MFSLAGLLSLGGLAVVAGRAAGTLMICRLRVRKRLGTQPQGTFPLEAAGFLPVPPTQRK